MLMVLNFGIRMENVTIISTVTGCIFCGAKKGTKMDTLHILNDRLSKLLADPHPGLISWCRAVRATENAMIPPAEEAVSSKKDCRLSKTISKDKFEL